MVGVGLMGSRPHRAQWGQNPIGSRPQGAHGNGGDKSLWDQDPKGQNGNGGDGSLWDGDPTGYMGTVGWVLWDQDPTGHKGDRTP